MSQISLLFLWPYPLLLLIAAITDLKKYIIPNSVCLWLVIAFFPIFIISGLGFDVLKSHVLAGGLILLIGFGLFAFNIFGAGDAKLLAAVSLWVGLEPLLKMVIITSLLGGVLAISYLLIRRVCRFFPILRVWSSWVNMIVTMTPFHIPYGVAIAVAAIFVFPDTELYNAFYSWNTKF